MILGCPVEVRVAEIQGNVRSRMILNGANVRSGGTKDSLLGEENVDDKLGVESPVARVGEDEDGGNGQMGW